MRPGLTLLPDLATYPGAKYNIRTVPGKDLPSHRFGKAARFVYSYSENSSYQIFNSSPAQSGRKNHETAQRKLSLPPDGSYKSSSALLRDDSPGPGSYNTSPQLNGRKSSFGYGERSSIVNRNCDPIGPGAFNMRSEILSKRGAYLTSKQPFSFQINDSPGPGTYNPMKLDLSSRISFSKGRRHISMPLKR